MGYYTFLGREPNAKLWYARKKLGLDQRDLAKLAGINPDQISLWERFSVPPAKLETILKIAEVLNVPAEWLCTPLEPPVRTSDEEEVEEE